MAYCPHGIDWLECSTLFRPITVQRKFHLPQPIFPLLYSLEICFESLVFLLVRLQPALDGLAAKWNLPNSQFLLTGKICRILPSDFFVRTYALATKHIAFLDLAFIIRRQNGHVSVPCQRPVLFNNPGIHDHSLPLDGRDLEKMLVVDTSNFNTFVSNSISFQGPLSWLLG